MKQRHKTPTQNTKTNTMTTDTFRSAALGALGYMVSGKPMIVVAGG